MCVVAAIALSAVAVIGLAGWTAAPAGSPTATCDRVVIPGEPVSCRPKRVVLGVVAVPPAYVPQTVDSGDRRWP